MSSSASFTYEIFFLDGSPAYPLSALRSFRGDARRPGNGQRAESPDHVDPAALLSDQECTVQESEQKH